MIAQKQFLDSKFSGFYNVGPDDCGCVTTGELVDMFCTAWGDGLAWESRSDGGPHEAGFLKLDCSKIKGHLGWRPAWDVRQAVENTVEWSKDYMDGKDIAACIDRQINEFTS